MKSEEWFYTRDKRKIGPFSTRQLKDLAELGEIVPTDTIWREGTARGVLASSLKHLYAPVPSAPPPPAAVPAVEPSPALSSSDGILVAPSLPADPEATDELPAPPTPKKHTPARAVNRERNMQ